MDYRQIPPNNEEPRDRQSRGSILFSPINPLNGNTEDQSRAPQYSKKYPGAS